jgi:hypothetical protein
MECVVQGIIETQHVEALEILLQGLCGVQRERLRVHELCLRSGPNLGVVSSEVRLLCDLDQPEPTWYSFFLLLLLLYMFLFHSKEANLRTIGRLNMLVVR